MDKIRSDLVIRLDESNECFCFFTAKTKDVDAHVDGQGSKAQLFPVEIRLENLRDLGCVEAERLIGKSVLGFFDHLTNGRLDLPKHYLDDSEYLPVSE